MQYPEKPRKEAFFSMFLDDDIYCLLLAAIAKIVI